MMTAASRLGIAVIVNSFAITADAIDNRLQSPWSPDHALAHHPAGGIECRTEAALRGHEAGQGPKSAKAGYGCLFKVL